MIPQAVPVPMPAPQQDAIAEIEPTTRAEVLSALDEYCSEPAERPICAKLAPQGQPR